MSKNQMNKITLNDLFAKVGMYEKIAYHSSGELFQSLSQVNGKPEVLNLKHLIGRLIEVHLLIAGTHPGTGLLLNTAS